MTRLGRVIYLVLASLLLLAAQAQPALFDKVKSFSEGLAAVQVDDKWGYIDASGQVVIAPQFLDVKPFSGGLAAVTYDEEGYFDPQMWAYIDKTGATVIPPRVSHAFPSRIPSFPAHPDGVVAAWFEAEAGGTDTEPAFNVGLFDKQGRVVVEFPLRQSIPGAIGEMTVSTAGDSIVFHRLGEETFVYDTRGRLIADFANASLGIGGVEHIGAANEGALRFYIRDDSGQPKGSYLTLEGRLLTRQFFDMFQPFAGGLAAIKVDGSYGFLDHAGQVVFTTPYRLNAARFSEGRVAVFVNGKQGYLDRQGRLVIAARFEQALPFQEGLAAVEVGDVWGFIDAEGKLVTRPRFDQVLAFSGGYAAVSVEGRWGFVDSDGNMRIEPRFDDALSFHEGYAAVKMGDQWGFIDTQGRLMGR